MISHSASFATDATAILFGDILAITPLDEKTATGTLDVVPNEVAVASGREA